MKTNIIIYSEELNNDDIVKLLQCIRDCEQQHFKDKTLGIAVFVPEWSKEECRQALAKIQPPFPFMPVPFVGGAI